jgi:hypothetical protein
MIREKTQKTGPIIVDLTGPDGNAFSLMALANKLAKQLGFKSPVDEMMKGDYEHLLEVFDKNFGDFVILER